jgi:hypothetical protein
MVVILLAKIAGGPRSVKILQLKLCFQYHVCTEYFNVTNYICKTHTLFKNYTEMIQTKLSF